MHHFNRVVCFVYSTPLPNNMADEDVAALDLDNGSGVFKAGFAPLITALVVCGFRLLQRPAAMEGLLLLFLFIFYFVYYYYDAVFVPSSVTLPDAQYVG